MSQKRSHRRLVMRFPADNSDRQQRKIVVENVGVPVGCRLDVPRCERGFTSTVYVPKSTFRNVIPPPGSLLENDSDIAMPAGMRCTNSGGRC